MNAKLLTRDEFNRICLERDKHKCIYCKMSENIVVHHILERKLFPDGGYYKKNGATLCPECHIKAEASFILPSILWARIGCDINTCVYPPDCDKSTAIDKWGQELIVGKDDGSFILYPNHFKEQFEKAVRFAGGSVREVSPEWMLKYENRNCKGACLHVVKLRNFYYD